MILGILLKIKEKNVSRKQKASSVSSGQGNDIAWIHSVSKRVSIQYRLRKSKRFFGR
jgi:hypothetical protein